MREQLIEEARTDAQGIKRRYADEKMLFGEAEDLDDMADVIFALCDALEQDERERERLHGWLNAIAPMCQWLDYHAADVIEWGESETTAHEAMHEAVAAYESAYATAQEDSSEAEGKP